MAPMRTHERPYVAAPCPCDRWVWYELVLAPGLSLHERHCPRCRRRYLLLFRTGKFEGAVHLTGRDLGSIREALARLQALSPVEADLVLEVARLMVEAA